MVEITQRSLHNEEVATWTAFNLPGDQRWPRQDKDLSRSPFGIVDGIPGISLVYLGRQLQNPEQAVFVMLWTDANAIDVFEASSAYSAFLADLGIKAGHRLVRLARAPKCRLHYAFEGMVSFTKFDIHREESSGEDILEALTTAFARFLPPGYPNIKVGLRVFFIQCWLKQEEPRPLPIDASEDPHVVQDETWYHTFSWNRHSSNAELDQAAAMFPENLQYWKSRVDKVSSLVKDWEVQIWQFEEMPWYSWSDDEITDNSEEEVVGVERDEAEAISNMSLETSEGGPNDQ